MERLYLNPAALAPPAAPFTYGVRCGDLFFLAGHVSFDDQNRVVGSGDPERQAVQCWDNIEIALEDAGGSLANVVKIQVFLKDIRFAEAEQTVRVDRFKDLTLPACTLVEVSNLGSPELLMEIDAIAVL
jgi:2-iminobutanoate/2-iminopropanoate deaminase